MNGNWRVVWDGSAGEIDPSFIVTHRLRLDDAALGYELFCNKEDECIKVVMRA